MKIDDALTQRNRGDARQARAPEQDRKVIPLDEFRHLWLRRRHMLAGPFAVAVAALAFSPPDSAA